MLDSVKNIFAIPDLRKRVIFTFLMLAVYRVGGHIPTPGIDGRALADFFSNQETGVLGFLDLFAGGNLSRLTIFALGIMPYISSSIILQLLTVIWPYLEKLSKEGDAGRKKITQYTRYGTVALSIVQSLGIAIWLESLEGGRVVPSPGIGFKVMTILTLTTGTAFIMWLGEQITERGIGNGISLIIFAGIVVALPNAILHTFQDLSSGQKNLIFVAFMVVMMIAVIAAIVLVERAQRRIPVQYARRVVGRKVMGGMSTHLPLRVNTGGVIPVIFASSVLSIPQTLVTFGGLSEIAWVREFANQLNYNMPVYNLLYVTGIIFFCYFYVSIIFNPMDAADNMKKYGGFIPGIRPGKRTAEYIDKVLTHLTFGGSVYLALVSILPIFLISGLNLSALPWVGATFDTLLPSWVNRGFNVKFYFGGTSLLIVVGVAMDTIQQVESQLIMRHYDGFMRGSRVRGRRG
jgi:preprotein translocase subunit SecY